MIAPEVRLGEVVVLHKEGGTRLPAVDAAPQLLQTSSSSWFPWLFLAIVIGGGYWVTRRLERGR